MNAVIFSIVILTVILNTAAQLALKIGMEKIGTFVFSCENIAPITFKIVTSPWIISGITVYTLSVAAWLLVLSRIPVSIAYPMASLAYVTSAIAAYYFLNEDVSLLRIMGILVILIGVYLVAKS